MFRIVGEGDGLLHTSFHHSKIHRSRGNLFEDDYKELRRIKKEAEAFSRISMEYKDMIDNQKKQIDDLKEDKRLMQNYYEEKIDDLNKKIENIYA